MVSKQNILSFSHHRPMLISGDDWFVLNLDNLNTL